MLGITKADNITNSTITKNSASALYLQLSIEGPG